jgi:hypothetical protein
MSVRRASHILLALYIKLLELGIEPAEAGQVIQSISHTELVTKYKEGLVDLILPDIEATWKELQSIEKPLDMDAGWMLAAACRCHHEPEQLIY